MQREDVQLSDGSFGVKVKLLVQISIRTTVPKLPSFNHTYGQKAWIGLPLSHLNRRQTVVKYLSTD